MSINDIHNEMRILLANRFREREKERKGGKRGWESERESNPISPHYNNYQLYQEIYTLCLQLIQL